MLQYRQAVSSKFYPLQQKQKSFMSFGFGAGSSGTNISATSAGRRESHVNVNVTPTSHGEITSDTPEIRKYKKRFNSEILCAALWGNVLTPQKVVSLSNYFLDLCFYSQA